MKNNLIKLMAVLFCVMFFGCGKSEIDKCVDAKIENYLSDVGKIAGACGRICKVPPIEEFGNITETEKQLISDCLIKCSSNASERGDVKQLIKTKHEAEIRLECLRAASGKS